MYCHKLKNPVITVFALLCCFLLAGCSDDECPTNPEEVTPRGSTVSMEFLHPQPSPGNYTGVWVAGTNDVFVCGGRGRVMRGQGSTWTRYETPTRYQLNGIWGSSVYDVFAVGDGGTIIRYNGTAWTTMTTNVLYSLRAVWGSAHNDIYAVGYLGNILHYDGVAWETVDTGLITGTGNWYLYDVWGTSADDVYVVGYYRNGSSEGLIWHYDGSGWSETRVGTRFYCVSGTASNNVFAGGSNGILYRFNGSDWLQQSNLGSDDLNAIWCASATDIWTGGHGYDYGLSRYIGPLWRFNGMSWVEQTGSIFMDEIMGIAGSAADDVYIVGAGNQLARFDGSDWSFISTLRVTGNDLGAIWGFSENDIWAAGQYETILHFDGTSWSAVEGTDDIYLSGLWGSAPNDLYAVGNGGTILHYDGSSWNEVVHGLTTESLESIWGTSAGDIWAGGANGTLLRYSRGIWQDHNLRDVTHGWVNDIWGSSPADYYFVVEGSIIHYDGSDWDILTLPEFRASAVHGASADQVYFTATADMIMAMTTGKQTGPDAAQPPGTFAVFRYTGSDFIKLNIQTSAWLGDLWVFAGNNIYFTGGPFATVAHFNGAVMSESSLEEDLWFSQLWGTGGNTIYTTGSMGTVARATAR